MDKQSPRRFIGRTTRRRTFLALAAAAVVFGCGRAEDARPLLGRWHMVEGTSAIFEFLDAGLLIGVMDGDQEFGSYEVIRQGTVLLMLDGDTVMADFQVDGDTLRLNVVGGAVLLGVRDDG